EDAGGCSGGDGDGVSPWCGEASGSEGTDCRRVAADSTDAYLNRAVVRERLREFDEAEADYTKAVELDPNRADAWTGRGILREMRRGYPGALGDKKRAFLPA